METIYFDHDDTRYVATVDRESWDTEMSVAVTRERDQAPVFGMYIEYSSGEQVLRPYAESLPVDVMRKGIEIFKACIERYVK